MTQNFTRFGVAGCGSPIHNMNGLILAPEIQMEGREHNNLPAIRLMQRTMPSDPDVARKVASQAGQAAISMPDNSATKPLTAAYRPITPHYTRAPTTSSAQQVANGSIWPDVISYLRSPPAKSEPSLLGLHGKSSSTSCVHTRVHRLHRQLLILVLPKGPGRGIDLFYSGRCEPIRSPVT